LILLVLISSFFTTSAKNNYFSGIKANAMRPCTVLLFVFLCSFTPVKKDIPASIYGFQVAAYNGGTINFADYKNKKILIVNAPADNDYDQQYAQLNDLYKKYKGKLVIIGFLADDFAVAPGTKTDRSYGAKDYKVSFPVAAMVQIRGNDMAAIYHWLTEKDYNNFSNSEIKWNFQKYLINENGSLIAVFDPKIKASDPKIISAIEN
jgi:glutathione peroxidase